MGNVGLGPTAKDQKLQSHSLSPSAQKRAALSRAAHAENPRELPLALMSFHRYVSLPVSDFFQRREVPAGPRGPICVSGQKISKKLREPLDETETHKVCWEATAKSGQLNELFDN
jgi:hypothetical protein